MIGDRRRHGVGRHIVRNGSAGCRQAAAWVSGAVQPRATIISDEHHAHTASGTIDGCCHQTAPSLRAS